MPKMSVGSGYILPMSVADIGFLQIWWLILQKSLAMRPASKSPLLTLYEPGLNKRS